MYPTLCSPELGSGEPQSLILAPVSEEVGSMSPALWTQLRTGVPAPGSEEVLRVRILEADSPLGQIL